MLDRILNNKKLFLLLVLIVLSFISFAWIVSKIRKSEINTPIPTPESVFFELIRTIPENNSINTIPSTTSILFYFSKPVDLSTLVLNSNPKSNLTFETDNNDTVLYVRNQDGWQYDTQYKITINISSKDKQPLPENINFNFKTTRITRSDMDEIPQP